MSPAGPLLILFTFSPLAFSADYQIEANIRYSQYPETVLDIVQSPAPALKNRPGVIVIHGDGDKSSTLEKFCVPLAQHDFVVANVEYRPAKADAVSDVLQAALWFHNHAARFKVDPDQILVLGESAGGELALMVAMTPVIKIAAVINFYGISDITDRVRRGIPPTLSIHGDEDPIVPYDQSVRLTKALKEAGADADLITVSTNEHGFNAAEMSKLWPQIFKWLKKRKIAP
jgi:acetyl esterase/lipase